MRLIDVLIMFENKNRELESVLLLERILLERGYSVAVVQNQWNEKTARWKYSPKVIVTPWCYDETDYRYFASYVGGKTGNTFDLVNLHCEQIVYADALEFYMPKGDAANVYHCAWGSYYGEKLVENGVRDELISITGSPRLDFFKHGFAFETKETLSRQYGLDSSKKWVLIVGNFSGAFMDDIDMDLIEQRGLTGMRERRETSMRSYQAVLDWIDNLCSIRDVADKAQIIYRPHPSEPISDRLRDMECKHSCLTVTKDLSIREWFQNCDIGFNWCSTSSVEAAVAGMPIFSLRPYPIPENEQIELVESLDQLIDEGQFVDTVRNCLSGAHVSTSAKFLSALNGYYSMGEKLATEQTADLVERCILGSGGIVRGVKHNDFASVWRSVKYSVKVILQRLGLLRKISRFQGQIDNLAQRDEVQRSRRVVDEYWARRGQCR